MTHYHGPTLSISREIQAAKHLGTGETHDEYSARFAGVTGQSEQHRAHVRECVGLQRFLPAGRLQSSVGSPRQTTAFNCFVSVGIQDSMEGILKALSEAAQTMRLGGGIGYDFSSLRPRGAHISTLDSSSSGPVAFMDVFNAMCGTISSAGHRRGAQMGVLRVDHPDIEEFVRAKQNKYKLRNFNISVGVTDEFMHAVYTDSEFALRWNGETYKTVRATALWDEIMRSTWTWDEPGVLFIDTINEKNNLRYCESIAATNPCGEQPLPPYGACLLGSFNLVKYIKEDKEFDYEQFKHDIVTIVEAMDNVIDNTIYPLPQQEEEAKQKRRMGLGITGFANLCAVQSRSYGSVASLDLLSRILTTLRDTAYTTSVSLATEKGPFPLFDADKYLKEGTFASSLPEDIKENIRQHGIRNSHLLSIAPCGTISLCADNVSSGIEPVFAREYERKIVEFDEVRTEVVQDWAHARGYQVETSEELDVEAHVKVLTTASKLVDSACSKTINIGPKVSWQEFKEIYSYVYNHGGSGCTTYRPDSNKQAVLKSRDTVQHIPENEGSACFIDPATGIRSCE
jgi:ribonucleoside-diphosphate reductase alpha chain